MPLPPLVMAKLVDLTPTTAYHKAFMSAKSTNFYSKEGQDKVEQWLRKIEKAFGIIKVPEILKVRFGTYMLIEDAEV